MFWTPARGYSWGHAHYCYEKECPNSEHPVDVFFIAPELDGSAIQQAGASGQWKSSETNPVPNAVASDESDDDAAIVCSASSAGDTSGKETKKRKEKEDGPGMCGKWDMSVGYVSGICQLIRV